MYVSAFGHIPELMGVSRAVVSQHPMGRPLGAPGDSQRQLEVVRAALDLLPGAAPTIDLLPATYRAGPT